MDTLRTNKYFRHGLFAAVFILLQLNFVACTGQKAASSLTSSGGVTIPPTGSGNPFGDDFQIDDPFGTGDDFNADDFVLTDTGSAGDLDDPLFDLDGSDASLENDCIDNDLFASGGFFTPDNSSASSCLSADQLASAGSFGEQSFSPLQLLMSQMTQGTMYGLSCINVAYLYQPVVNQDPELGFVLAMAGITDCYHNIFAQVAGSRYWSQGSAVRMQSFEPQWISLIQSALNH